MHQIVVVVMLAIVIKVVLLVVIIVLVTVALAILKPVAILVHCFARIIKSMNMILVLVELSNLPLR